MFSPQLPPFDFVEIFGIAVDFVQRTTLYDFTSNGVGFCKVSVEDVYRLKTIL